MKIKATALAIATVTLVTPAFAAMQTVLLSIPGMSCPSCPYIIQAAIGAVEGVELVETSFEYRMAYVVFDDEITSIYEIIFSTTDVGYESFLIEEEAGS